MSYAIDIPPPQEPPRYLRIMQSPTGEAIYTLDLWTGDLISYWQPGRIRSIGGNGRKVKHTHGSYTLVAWDGSRVRLTRRKMLSVVLESYWQDALDARRDMV